MNDTLLSRSKIYYGGKEVGEGYKMGARHCWRTPSSESIDF